MKIILASSSPRRMEILKSMNITFEVIPSNIEEKTTSCGKIEENAINIAKQKSINIFEKITGNKIVIGADTIVIYDNQILGKPQNEEKAKEMLMLLSGKECMAYTGMYVIVENNKEIREYENISNCKIKLKVLTEEEIKEYIKTEEPMDKAGGFAIQGIGSKFIENVQGDFYSGIGLSVHEMYKIFKQINKDFHIDLKL